jgi:hypothetical protein
MLGDSPVAERLGLSATKYWKQKIISASVLYEICNVVRFTAVGVETKNRDKWETSMKTT